METEDAMYSGETLCKMPCRNKIYGHLFAKEDELEVEVKKLQKQVDELEYFKREYELWKAQRSQWLALTGAISAQQNCIVPYGYGNWYSATNAWPRGLV